MSDDRRSGDELVKALYGELRKLARARMARLCPGQTLQPTALVNEAYLRLARSDDSGWNGPGHFFGAAARAMRDILVEEARRKAAIKRGGDQVRVDVTITLADGDVSTSAEELLALHRALEKMHEAHPEHAEIVLFRYFTGLTVEQIAAYLNVHTRTIERRWRFARAWLKKELHPQTPSR